MKPYTLLQAVEWLSTHDDEWAALSPAEWTPRRMYPEHAQPPPRLIDGGASAVELLQLLRGKKVQGVDGEGQKIPVERWLVIDADMLREPRLGPRWLSGVRLDAETLQRVAEKQRAKPLNMPRKPDHVVKKWLLDFLDRVESGAEPRIRAKVIQARCRAELQCPQSQVAQVWGEIEHPIKRKSGRPTKLPRL